MYLAWEFMCVRLLSPLSPEVEHCESIGREFNRPISQLALLKMVYAMVLQRKMCVRVSVLYTGQIKNLVCHMWLRCHMLWAIHLMVE